MRSLRLWFIVESGTDVRLVEGLAELFNLTVVARKIEGGIEISHPPSVPVAAVVGPASRLTFAMLVWKQLRQKRDQIDLVMAQGYGLAALAANLASRLSGTPSLMLVCSPIEAYYQCRKAHPEAGKPFRLRELWGLRALARVNAVLGQRYLVLSEHLAQVVRGHGTRRPVDVVPLYGVDTRVFVPPREPKALIRARLGLPADGALIFFSSRIAPEKDSETLILAIKRVLKMGRNIWLLHRSGGYRALIKEAERFGIAERVIATDAVHPYRQLPLDYQASDLCVQASREEGLGFSALESLACGVPVIAAAVGGLKETILDGQTGWTYQVGDSAALTKCIEAVLDDPIEASRRAAAGRALVCSRYERRVVFEQLTKIIAVPEELESSRRLAEAP
jgi:glycosyltransferase involved in cell wall biosynthesis